MLYRLQEKLGGAAALYPLSAPPLLLPPPRSWFEPDNQRGEGRFERFLRQYYLPVLTCSKDEAGSVLRPGNSFFVVCDSRDSRDASLSPCFRNCGSVEVGRCTG